MCQNSESKYARRASICSPDRRLEPSEGDKWQALRRGWYVVGESFVEQLARYLEGAVWGRRELHSGQAKSAHDEQAAATVMELALWER